MVISVCAFALMNGAVKYLQNFSAYQIVFFRSMGTLFFTVPLLLHKKIPLLGNNKKWLLLRGAAGVISLTFFFQSLHYIPLGTAVSLRYTSPVYATLFAWFFLKERVKPIQWFLFLIAFFGVLIIKGFGAELQSFGLFLVMLSALFLGLIFVVIRKIGTAEHPLVIVNYFMVMAFVFGGLMSVQHWSQPNLSEWFWLLSLGVFGYVGQLYLTKALQSHETTMVAPLKYLEVVFVLLIGAFWFGESYSLMTLFGVVLIVFSLIANIYIKSKNK